MNDKINEILANNGTQIKKKYGLDVNYSDVKESISSIANINSKQPTEDRHSISLTNKQIFFLHALLDHTEPENYVWILKDAFTNVMFNSKITFSEEGMGDVFSLYYLADVFRLLM
jgi:hypothetical protein